MNNKTEIKSEYIPVRTSKKLKDELLILAKKDRRSLGEYIRIVLEDHVKGRSDR